MFTSAAGEGFVAFDDQSMTDQDDQKEPGAATGLVVEPAESAEDKDSFSRELQQTLEETERAVLGAASTAMSPSEMKSWQHARDIVQQFRPVPWFIWRLSNFALGKSGTNRSLSEGMVFGLRRLMFAAASDPSLGKGEKVSSVRQALEIVPSDVVAAVAVLYAVNKRLSSSQHERIWRPILDDAILRARLGLMIGARDESFGAGRAILAGYAGRCGLAILIAQGQLEQARSALEMLATGSEIKKVGFSIYECDPLQVSALTLTAAGCGRDAAFGTVSYSIEPQFRTSISGESEEQQRWLSAFSVIEALRAGKLNEVSWPFLERYQLTDPQEQEEILADAKKIIRRGHGWNWLG